MKKILDNKFVKILFTILKILVWIFVLCIVAIVLVQRIFDNKVSIGDYRMFTIVSGSMKPEYDIYDVVIVKKEKAEDIKVGDDVSYLGKEGTFNDKIVTHRVIKVDNKNGEYNYTTKGTANDVADPEISYNQIYGVVAYKPGLLSFLSKVLNNSYGFYFLIFVPVAFLVFLEILDHIKNKEEELDEEGNDKEA